MERSSPREPSLAPIAPDASVHFTSEQRFLWTRHGSNDCMYRILPFPFLLTGCIEPDLIGRSLDLLVLRHDTLRTRLTLVGDEPMLRFVESGACHCEVVNVATSDDIDEKIRYELSTRAARKLEFDRDPLFSATLFILSVERQVIVFWIHHLLFDAYSLTHMLHEFWTHYAGLRSKSILHEEKPLPYFEYRAWRESFSLLREEERRQYWNSRLAGSIGIQWPNVPSEPISVPGTTEVATRVVDRPLLAKLREHARGFRVPLSTYVLAAYVSVVGSWCDRRDFVLTMMTTSRVKREHRMIAAFLAQPLYLRMQCDPREPFNQVLRTVQREHFNAVSHMDFGESVLQNPGLVSGTIFQWVPADWLATPPASLNLGFRAEAFEFERRFFLHEMFKIAVSISEGHDKLFVTVLFRPDYFQQRMVEQILENLLSRLRESCDGTS